MGMTSIPNIMHALMDAIAPLHCETCNERIDGLTHVHRVCDACLYLFESAPKDDVLLNQLYTQSNKDSFVISMESHFAFHQEAPIQQTIHAIKYENAQQMAFDFGSYIARNRKHSEVDYYVPVPLHSARVRERGYNQSLLIAQGISSITKVPVINALERLHYSTTQTKLSSNDRMQNVQGIFSIKKADLIRDKRLMLIDDVMTTGSTLEECAHVLLDSGACSVSAFTLAAATSTREIQ
jgi:ComF family protein